MSNDIRDILSRLDVLEGNLTPTSVKHGLNPQQKSVPQLPALFKPKHISVLGAKTDPEHPAKDYFVGAESVESPVEESHMSNIDQLMQDIGTGEVDIYDIYAHPSTPEEEYASKIINKMYDDVTIDQGLHPDDQFEEILEIVADRIAHDYPVDELNEAVATEEKLLDKVKKSLTDYLTSIEKKYKDDNISKKAKDKDLGKKPADHDLTVKEGPDEDDEDDDQRDLPSDRAYQRGESPYDAPEPQVECAAVKTYTFEDGRICEIHGDEGIGFAVKHGNNTLPSRFQTLDEAELACKMYEARCRKSLESADYVEEA